MKKLLKLYRKQGITLVEIMVSLGVLTVSTMSVLGLSVYSAKVGKQSESRAAALAIARTKLDEILSISQSNRTPCEDEPLVVSSDLQQSMPGNNVTASYSIRPVTGSTNLQSLEVVVTWQNVAGNSISTKSSVACSRIISSTTNLDWTLDPWHPHPIDQLFYTPPPPPPPSTTTGGGSTGSSTTTSTTSTTASTTTGSTTGDSAGGTTGTTGSTTGSSTTGSTSTTASTTTTGTTDPIYKGFNPGGGNKWK